MDNTRPLTAADAPLADAMYECCVSPPETDHADHVLAALNRNGWTLTRLDAARADRDPALRKAAVLRRNVRFGDDNPQTFSGDWVAVPAEDFEALRAALTAPPEEPTDD